MRDDGAATSQCSGRDSCFPQYFALKSSFICCGQGRTYRAVLEVWVDYGRQMHFAIRGPLFSTVARGCVDQRGISWVDCFNRLSYVLDYRQIREQYGFLLNYPLIQSLLLAQAYTDTVSDSIDADIPQSGDLMKYLSYTYDHRDLSLLVRSQLKDRQGKVDLVFSYLYKEKNKKLGRYSFNDLKGIRVTVLDKSSSVDRRYKLYLPHLYFECKKCFKGCLAIPPVT